MVDILLFFVSMFIPGKIFSAPFRFIARKMVPGLEPLLIWIRKQSAKLGADVLSKKVRTEGLSYVTKTGGPDLMKDKGLMAFAGKTVKAFFTKWGGFLPLGLGVTAAGLIEGFKHLGIHDEEVDKKLAEQHNRSIEEWSKAATHFVEQYGYLTATMDGQAYGHDLSSYEMNSKYIAHEYEQHVIPALRTLNVSSVKDVLQLRALMEADPDLLVAFASYEESRGGR